MQQRRHFLTVIGAGVATAACGGSDASSSNEAGAGGTTASGGTSGVGGAAGNGAGGQSNGGQSSGGQGTGGQGTGGQGTGGQGTGGQAQAGQGGTGGAQGGSGPGGAGPGGSGGSAPMCSTPPAGISLGPVGAYAAMGLHKTPKSSDAILVGRDVDGLYALSAVCTHEFCNMDTANGMIVANGIRCVCHGSAFSETGAVTKGPASKPLAAFELLLCADGNLYVDKTKVVPVTQRLSA